MLMTVTVLTRPPAFPPRAQCTMYSSGMSSYRSTSLHFKAYMTGFHRKRKVARAQMPPSLGTLYSTSTQQLIVGRVQSRRCPRPHQMGSHDAATQQSCEPLSRAPVLPLRRTAWWLPRQSYRCRLLPRMPTKSTIRRPRRRNTTQTQWPRGWWARDLRRPRRMATGTMRHRRHP